MTSIITINLDEETDKIRKEIFDKKGTKGEFSGWVRQKLIEEHQKKNDIGYIVNQINEKKQLQELTNKEIEFLEKELKKARNIKEAREQVKQEEIQRTTKKETLDDKAKRKEFFIVQYFGVKEEDCIIELAKELASMEETNKDEPFTSLLIKLAIWKGLRFTKQFHFLDGYALPNEILPIDQCTKQEPVS